jgi:hypothetical protein
MFSHADVEPKKTDDSPLTRKITKIKISIAASRNKYVSEHVKKKNSIPKQLNSHYQVTSEGGLDLNCSKFFPWYTRRQHRRLCWLGRGGLYSNMLAVLLGFRDPIHLLLCLAKSWLSRRRRHRDIDFQRGRWGQI